MNAGAMGSGTIRRADRLCAGLLVAYVLWVCAAHPWLQDVGCLRAGPVLLRRLTIIAELGIFVPYTWMPVSLVLTWRAARARPGATILILYGAFIVLCGLTHLVGALSVPWADYAISDPPEPTRLYWLAMKIKTATAAVSLAVARVTDQQRKGLLALSDQQGEIVRQRDEAVAARQEAEAHRAELAHAKDELERSNLELEQARAAESERARSQASRAQTAESANADLERMLAELRQKDARIAAQGEALRTLHTPILQVPGGALVTILVGTLDSMQVADWTERLLDQVSVTKSRTTIFDLTPLLMVDTAVADAIIKAARSVKLLGSRCVLTGMRPHVAQTIVAQGIDLGDFAALPTLCEAISQAMKRAP